MSLSNFHKLPEIQKLLNQLEDDVFSLRITHKDEYADGIEETVKMVREIIDSA